MVVSRAKHITKDKESRSTNNANVNHRSEWHVKQHLDSYLKIVAKL